MRVSSRFSAPLTLRLPGHPPRVVKCEHRFLHLPAFIAGLVGACRAASVVNVYVCVYVCARAPATLFVLLIS